WQYDKRHQEIDGHDDDERQCRKQGGWCGIAMMPVLYFRRIEFSRGRSSLADHLIICSSIDADGCFGSITLACSPSGSLGAHEPPQAATKHDDRRDDTETGRSKWRRAKERHRDGVLNRRRPG